MIEDCKLSVLADQLINRIKTNSDFFSGVTVIFPDQNVEKWFKSYWLKKEKDVLMNLNTKIIRNALFDLYKNEEGYSLITKDILGMLILKKLTVDEYESDSIIPKYKNYIYNSEEKTFNSVNLIDLSNELATALMEYEQGTADLVDDWELDFYKRILEEAKDKYKLVSLSNIENEFVDDKSTIYFFGFIDFTPKQKEIIDIYSKNHDVVIYKLKLDTQLKKTDATFKILTAPSKLREIETLHTEICAVVKEKHYSFSDFLVVCPNLTEYETIINRVFKQDDIDFPNIPFSISNTEVQETDATQIVKKLIEIEHKGFFTRNDFFELITNPIIMRGRDITDNEINMWVNSILTTNVFRQRDNHDDWDYIRKRLLLSKVSNINDEENIIRLDHQDYIPYASIGFDDSSIVKLIKIIDDINDWVFALKNVKNADKTSLNLVKEQLNKWLSIPNEDGIESNKTYKSIIKLLDAWDKFEICNPNIPLSTLLFSILDVSKKARGTSGQILSSGITFVNFKTDYILGAKNIFFLGASSSNIPSKPSPSELYVLKNKVSDLEKTSFYLQYQNAGDLFVASYVNIDLKTEEDFYQSLFVDDLRKLYDGNIIETNTSLDEERDWNKLFTRREFKDKQYFKNLLGKENDSTGNENAPSEAENGQILTAKTLNSIRLKDVADYLLEPLMFQANRFLSDDNDDRNEMIDEYEPFGLDNLQRYKITQDLIVDGLNGKDITTDEYMFCIKNKLMLNNEQCGLSNKLDEDEIKELVSGADTIVKLIQESHAIETKTCDITFGDNDEKWTLKCNEEVYRVIEGNKRTYIRVRSGNINKYYLYIYAYALMDISVANENPGEDETIYEITLKSIDGVKEFKITKNEALSILNKIYLGINDIKNTKCIPFETKKSVKNAYDLLIAVRGKGGEWEHFNHSSVFDETMLGYDEDNFDYFEKDIEFKNLIKFIEIKKEENSNE